MSGRRHCNAAIHSGVCVCVRACRKVEKTRSDSCEQDFSLSSPKNSIKSKTNISAQQVSLVLFIIYIIIIIRLKLSHLKGSGKKQRKKCEKILVVARESNPWL